MTTRIENSLKRIEELIQNDQKQIAFQELQNMTSRKSAWSEPVEQAYKKFLEMCVELRKPSDAKSALTNYRAMTQISQIKSLDQIIAFYLDLVEKKAAAAEQESTAIIDEQGPKDDEEFYPEYIMMATVGGEDFKGRMDHQYVTPWLTFQWYSYRNVLDLLKTMGQLENRYHDTCARAIKYCKRHKNKYQLKQLSEMLRTHSSYIQKNSAQLLKRQESGDGAIAVSSRTVNIHTTSTLNQHIETRFKLLTVASDLEAWQEAFKVIEDIHTLIKLSRRMPRPSLMVTYYEQLSKLFLISRNHLLHAHANLRLFSLLHNIQHESTDDYSAKIQNAASLVLLATIALPSHDLTALDENTEPTIVFLEREKLVRLSGLLGKSCELPSKKQLVEQLSSVVPFAHAQVRPLYALFFGKRSNPLDFGARVNKALEFIKAGKRDTLSTFADTLVDVATVAILEKLSNVYDVVKIADVIALCPGDISQQRLERAIMNNSEQPNHVYITIDHQKGTVAFGIQDSRVAAFDSDKVRFQLVQFAKQLHRAAVLLEQKTGKQILPRRATAVQLTASMAEKDQKQLAERRDFIAKKKIWEEQERAKREERLAKLRKELAEKRAKLEQEQKALEERQRLEMLAARATQQERMNKAKELLVRLAEQSNIPHETLVKKIIASGSRIAKNVGISRVSNEDAAATILLEQSNILDSVTAILEAQDEERQKVVREREKKYTDIMRNLDYLERANREIESKIIEQEFERKKKEDKKLFEQTLQKEKEKLDVKAKQFKEKQQQYSKFFEDKQRFLNTYVIPKKQAELEQRKAEYEKKKEAAYELWVKKRELIREERKRRQADREVAERRRKEEEEIKKKEEEERRAEYDRVTEQQRRREEEIEAKLMAQQEASRPAGRWGAVAAGGEERGWRSRTAESAAPADEERGSWARGARRLPVGEAPAPVQEERGWSRPRRMPIDELSAPAAPASDSTEERGWSRPRRMPAGETSAPVAPAPAPVDTEERGWKRAARTERETTTEAPAEESRPWARREERTAPAPAEERWERGTTVKQPEKPAGQEDESGWSQVGTAKKPTGGARTRGRW